MSTSAKKACLVGLVFVVALPFIGRLLRSGKEGRCGLDGVVIHPEYEVRIEDQRGATHRFCSVTCAELWLNRQDHFPRAVWVTDEASGERIPARSAYFVRSLVTTVATSGNRIHAFKNRIDAENHARSCRGSLLENSDRPFAKILNEQAFEQASQR